MIIYHVNQSHSDDFLRSQGLITIQASSWNKCNINKVGVRNLVLAGLEHTADQNRTVHNSVVKCTLPTNTTSSNALQKYFDNFCCWVRDDVKMKAGKSLSADIVVFNFMPFFLAKSIVHKFLESLRDKISHNAHLNKPSLRLVFLVQNSQSFTGCWVTSIIDDDPKIKTSVHIIDYRGFCCSGTGRNIHTLDRTLFANIFTLDHNSLYKKLIYGTNSYIGHYHLSGAHVRTHYDLTDFVRNNDVSERILAKIRSLIDKYEYAWIVYVGYELDALYGLCSIIKDCLQHPQTEIYSAENIERRLHDKHPECVFLLSDIVCSGDTLKDVYGRIEAFREMNGCQFDVIPFTIIGMENSPSEIENSKLEKLLEVSRKYYKPNHKHCILCAVEQPFVEVKSVRDFRVITNFFTPYDFWEIVHDCGALRVREKDRSGRQLEVRIETRKIFTRYRHWLHNIVFAQYQENFGKKNPHVILTVNEPGGKAFSEIICESLSLNKGIILPIDRSILNVQSTHSGANEKSLFSGQRVLLADDGINGGSTMKMLNDYCLSRGGETVGIFVFDSRLEEQQVESLRSAMSRKPIMSLYRWPGTGIL